MEIFLMKRIEGFITVQKIFKKFLGLENENVLALALNLSRQLGNFSVTSVKIRGVR